VGGHPGLETDTRRIPGFISQHAIEPIKTRTDTNMTKDNVEPAKIIGNVDLKKVERHDGHAVMQKADINEEGAASTLNTASNIGSSSESLLKAQEESMTDMIQRFEEQDRNRNAGSDVSASLPVAASTPPSVRPTVKEMVDEVKKLIVEFVGKGLEAIGAYLLTNVFDGNFKKALSKDPYKGTSLNDLARHKEMPLSRQRLSECIRAAGVSAELNSLGLDLDSLTVYHKVELSRIKNPELRVQLARRLMKSR
jgi:hypothetical protein